MEHDMIQYLQLYERLNKEHESDYTCSVTIAELADLLCCTPRNVKLIIRRLEAHGWIVWQPGRGRGNSSRLQFLCSNGDMLEERIQHLLHRDKVKEALDLVSAFEGDEHVRERLSQRINIYLGLHQEREESSRQDVLRMVRYRPLGKLDTVLVFSAFEIFLMRHIFDTLVAYDSKTEQFIPKLAHLWECSDDGTAWTFYLRKGIRFHDGRLLTSHDVLATLERVKHRGENISWLYRDIESMELHDDYAFTFRLRRPNTMFLHLLSNINMAIVPAHEQAEEITINGTGPFRVSELNTSKMSLTAFDGYYGYRPILDRVDVWFLPQQGGSPRSYRMLTGTDEEETEQSNSRQLTQPALGGRYLLFNMRLPGVQHDIHFRRAIRLLYDRQTMQEELQGDRTSPAGSFLPWKSAQQTFARYSLEEAREQLAASSYNGETLILSFTYKREDRLEAEWIQQRAAAIGLHLELEAQEDRLLGGHIVLAVEVLEDDWEWDLINFFSNEVNHLHCLLDKEQLQVLHTMLYDVMRHERAEREHILEQMERKLQEEHWLLLGNHINQRAYFNRSLSGLHLDSFGFPNLSTMWIRDTFFITDKNTKM